MYLKGLTSGEVTVIAVLARIQITNSVYSQLTFIYCFDRTKIGNYDCLQSSSHSNLKYFRFATIGHNHTWFEIFRKLCPKYQIDIDVQKAPINGAHEHKKTINGDPPNIFVICAQCESCPSTTTDSLGSLLLYHIPFRDVRTRTPNACISTPQCM